MLDLFFKQTDNIKIEKDAGDGSMVMKAFHYHDTYEIYYLENGKRHYVIGEEYFSLQKGDVALIKPGVMHKTAGDFYVRTLVYFNDLYLRKYFTEEAIRILLSAFEKKVIRLTPEKEEKLNELISQIAALEKAGNKETAFIYLSDLLILLSDGTKVNDKASETAPTDGKIMSNILTYINDHFAEIENITQISDHFFITKYHLCRIFKTAINVSVIEYLNRVKIKNACNMLTNTNKSVTEICTLCGFNSSVYFCKLFKKLLKQTPSQYRLNMTKADVDHFVSHRDI